MPTGALAGLESSPERKRWDGKVKCGATVHHAFRPGPPAVPADDALDIGQPDARALKLGVTVQALEHAEQFPHVFRIETDAVVANENHGFALSVRSRTDFDSGLGAGASELYRVGNEIDQHHAQQGPVGPHPRQRVDFPHDVPPFYLLLEIAQGLPD